MSVWSYYLTRMTAVGAVVAAGEKLGFSGSAWLMNQGGGEWAITNSELSVTSQLLSINSNSRVVRAAQRKVEIRL